LSRLLLLLLLLLLLRLPLRLLLGLPVAMTWTEPRLRPALVFGYVQISIPLHRYSTQHALLVLLGM